VVFQRPEPTVPVLVRGFGWAAVFTAGAAGSARAVVQPIIDLPLLSTNAMT
jgi:hypothetical protein